MKKRINYNYPKIKNRLVIGLATFCLFPAISTHAQNSNIDYASAYKICAPVADKLVKSQCNYGSVFESRYTQCMNSYGYNDDSQVEQEFYDNYLKAYRYCSSISEQQTKEHCSYGIAYNAHYNRCMFQYGFNENGEKVNNQGRNQTFEFNF